MAARAASATTQGVNRAYYLLLAVPVGAGLYAWFGNDTTPAPKTESALPSNHPHVEDGTGAKPAPPPQATEQDDPNPTWKVPAGWQVVPPSPMRLATYKVPHAKDDPEDADVSVSRAGGGTEANLDRWAHQFQNASEPKRSTKTVHGLKVTVVELTGTYGGGMMPGGGAPEPKKNWALLGAVIETEGFATFVKMTGPAATVHGARKSFDELIDSVTPPAK